LVSLDRVNVKTFEDSQSGKKSHRGRGKKLHNLKLPFISFQGFHPFHLSIIFRRNLLNWVGLYFARCRSVGVTGLSVIVMNPGIAPAPPAAWATEQYGIENPEYYSERRIGRVTDAYDAWKHCKDVTREDTRPPDLYDLLSHSVGETQYAFPPKGVRPMMIFLYDISIAQKAIASRCTLYSSSDMLLYFSAVASTSAPGLTDGE
jgi:hypothetical protein